MNVINPKKDLLQRPKLFSARTVFIGTALLVISSKALFAAFGIHFLHPEIMFISSIVLSVVFLRVSSTLIRSIVIPFMFFSVIISSVEICGLLAGFLFNTGTGWGPAAILGIVPFVLGALFGFSIAAGILVALILWASRNQSIRYDIQEGC